MHPSLFISTVWCRTYASQGVVTSFRVAVRLCRAHRRTHSVRVPTNNLYACWYNGNTESIAYPHTQCASPAFDGLLYRYSIVFLRCVLWFVGFGSSCFVFALLTWSPRNHHFSLTRSPGACCCQKVQISIQILNTIDLSRWVAAMIFDLNYLALMLSTKCACVYVCVCNQSARETEIIELDNFIVFSFPKRAAR